MNNQQEWTLEDVRKYVQMSDKERESMRFSLDSKKNTLLHTASTNGTPEDVAAVFRTPEDQALTSYRNVDGRTPLLEALKNEKEKNAELLVLYSLKNASLLYSDNDGKNVLHYAAMHKYISVIQFVLELGKHFRTNSRNLTRNSLEELCKQSKMPTSPISLILRQTHGNDDEDHWLIDVQYNLITSVLINSGDISWGRTPLFFACKKKEESSEVGLWELTSQSEEEQSATAKLLIENGSDPFRQILNSEAPIHLIIRNQWEKLLQYLYEQDKLNWDHFEDFASPFLDSIRFGSIEIISLLLKLKCAQKELGHFFPYYIFEALRAKRHKVALFLKNSFIQSGLVYQTSVQVPRSSLKRIITTPDQRNNRVLSDKAMCFFFDSLNYPNFSVGSLVLARSGLNITLIDKLSRVITLFENLRELDLSENNLDLSWFGPNSTQIILTKLKDCRNLEQLKLRKCGLKQKDINDVIAIFHNRTKTLQFVDLSDNSDLGVLFAHLFLRSYDVTVNRMVKTINLEKTGAEVCVPDFEEFPLHDTSQDGLVLAPPPALRRNLTFAFNKEINDKKFREHLFNHAEGGKRSFHVRTLNARHCNLGNGAITALIKWLDRSPAASIERVIFDSNPDITDEGLRELIKALERWQKGKNYKKIGKISFGNIRGLNPALVEKIDELKDPPKSGTWQSGPRAAPLPRPVVPPLRHKGPPPQSNTPPLTSKQALPLSVESTLDLLKAQADDHVNEGRMRLQETDAPTSASAASVTLPEPPVNPSITVSEAQSHPASSDISLLHERSNEIKKSVAANQELAKREQEKDELQKQIASCPQDSAECATLRVQLNAIENTIHGLQSAVKKHDELVKRLFEVQLSKQRIQYPFANKENHLAFYRRLVIRLESSFIGMKAVESKLLQMNDDQICPTTTGEKIIVKLVEVPGFIAKNGLKLFGFEFLAGVVGGSVEVVKGGVLAFHTIQLKDAINKLRNAINSWSMDQLQDGAYRIAYELTMRYSYQLDIIKRNKNAGGWLKRFIDWMHSIAITEESINPIEELADYAILQILCNFANEKLKRMTGDHEKAEDEFVNLALGCIQRSDGLTDKIKAFFEKLDVVGVWIEPTPKDEWTVEEFYYGPGIVIETAAGPKYYHDDNNPDPKYRTNSKAFGFRKGTIHEVQILGYKEQQPKIEEVKEEQKPAISSAVPNNTNSSVQQLARQFETGSVSNCSSSHPPEAHIEGAMHTLVINNVTLKVPVHVYYVIQQFRADMDNQKKEMDEKLDKKEEKIKTLASRIQKQDKKIEEMEEDLNMLLPGRKNRKPTSAQSGQSKQAPETLSADKGNGASDPRPYDTLFLKNHKSSMNTLAEGADHSNVDKDISPSNP